MLATIAGLIDDQVASAHEQYAILSEACEQPHILDDATVSRVQHAFGDELDSMWLYEQQLDRWHKLSGLTHGQRVEVDRLIAELGPWRELVTMILQLAGELKRSTMNAMMRKSDAELGLDVVLGLRPRR